LIQAASAIWIIVALTIVLIFLVIKVLYLLTLYRALNRCSIESRAMQPGLVWLNLIPCFSLVWNFVIVNNLSKSLDAEFKKRGIPAEDRPGQTIGLAMAILCAVSLIPCVNYLAGPAAFICWIIYWVQIAGYSGKLTGLPPVVP